MEGLTGAGQLSPSDIAPLMAACINEGLRKNGSDKRFTADEIGEKCDITTMGEFMTIYVGQVTPRNGEASAEAKNPPRSPLRPQLRLQQRQQWNTV